MLFTDEAYAVANLGGAGADLGRAAIDTLLTSMEDNRSRIVVIVAGHPASMRRFIGSNPCPASRLGLGKGGTQRAIGMSASMPLMGRHGAAWLTDRWYRLAWLVGPQAIGVALIVWLNSADPKAPEPPRNPEWAHATDDRSEIAALDALRSRARTDSTAQHLLEQRADAGNKIAQFCVGTLDDPTIDRAHATPERTRRAIDAYRKSADQGVVSAMANLGLLLSRDDLGLEPDHSEAFKWLDRSAPRLPAAQRNLAFLYLRGRGVVLDRGKGMQLMRSAADRGDPIAERTLAGALDHGEDGLAADPHEAVLLYQKAALQNDVAAESELAAHLQSGRGVPADKDKAMFWFEKAAASGDGVAKAEIEAARGPASPAPQPESTRPANTVEVPPAAAPQISTATCSLKPLHGPGGRGAVVGFLSVPEAAKLLSQTQAMLGAPISPQYLHNIRAVISDERAGGSRRHVALVPSGMDVRRGDVVSFAPGHRDPTLPCNYVPNLVDAILLKAAPTP